jgi:hypothetical protein
VKLARAAALLLIPLALLAAGCGTAAKSASTLAVSRQAPVTPQQRAAADARAILAKFVPPPGAARLARPPTLPSGSPVMGITAAAQADATGFWRVSGSATALQAWEKAHISRGFSHQDVIIGPPSWNTVYSLPAVPGVLPTREMNVQFYDVGGGMTVIMAKAMVAWQPPRPAAEVVPASVTEVTIAEPGQPARSVTITSVPVVRRLAALVNGLPLSTVAQSIPCPSGSGFTLTFRARPGGPPAAVASGPGACGQVTFTLSGKHQPPLLPASAIEYRAAVMKIAGLRW